MGSTDGGARRFGAWLAVVALVGFVVRTVYVFTIAPTTLGFDAIWYELQSGTLAHGNGYVDPDLFYRLGIASPTANFPPLWSMVLAVGTRIGLDTPHGHQLIGAAVGSVTVVVTGLLGARVAGRRVGLLAAVLTAASPMLIAADGSLMSESLYVLLITVALWLAYRAMARPTWWWWFALQGVALGLAALTRSDALFVAPLLLAATAWRTVGASTGRRVALGLVGLVVTLAMLVPWTVRNQRQMGEPVLLSSNSGSVIEGANCDGTYFGPLFGAWDARCLVHTRVEGQPELEWSAAARQAGIDYARDHVARVPLVGAARIARSWSLWNPVAQADLEVVETRDRNWQVAAGLATIAMLVLAVPGAVVLRRRRAVLAPLGAVVIGVSLAALAANGNTRFTLAAQPVLAVLAAAVVLSWFGQPSSLPRIDTNETISPG